MIKQKIQLKFLLISDRFYTLNHLLKKKKSIIVVIVKCVSC